MIQEIRKDSGEYFNTFTKWSTAISERKTEPKECQEEIQVGVISAEEESDDSKTITTMVGERQEPRKLYRILYFTSIAQNKPEITKIPHFL